MAALGDHLNVIDTALDLLDRKGFQVWYDKPTDHYWAERDGWDFAARTATALLGLVAIFEAAQPDAYREYWWKSPRVRLREALPDKPRPYTPVYKQARKP